jgi:3-hydroxyisobutyrate dehydrogenase-like beta-hydroxyacid dehydrogenase
MTTVAFLGTGLLGAGFVRGLARRGHTVRAWNRTGANATALAASEPGVTAWASAAEAVRGADRVHLCLSDDDAVDGVLAGIVATLAGVPVIDHTTALPERVAARAARLVAAGVDYLPAPVFMGPANAEAATGLMVVSGPKALFDAHEAWLATMTGKVWYLGDAAGLAAANKLFGNAMLLSMVGALADVFQLARNAGVPEADAVTLLGALNPAGWIAARGARLAEATGHPASFTLEMARKDLRLMQEAAGDRPLLVLPGIAAAMDERIAAGQADADYTVIAGRRPAR